jgi:ribosome-binding factor A
MLVDPKEPIANKGEIMTGPGAHKVAEQIKFIAAEMLSRRIQDPRLGFVTITDVRLSKDWQAAEIFYTVFGDEKAHRGSAEALEAAKGQVRSAVARGVKMKFTPTISFIPDGLPETSEEFEALLDAVKKSDAEISAHAAEAQ